MKQYAKERYNQTCFEIKFIHFKIHAHTDTMKRNDKKKSLHFMYCTNRTPVASTYTPIKSLNTHTHSHFVAC